MNGNIKCIWLIQKNSSELTTTMTMMTRTKIGPVIHHLLCNYVSLIEDKINHFNWNWCFMLISNHNETSKTFVIRCTQPIFKYHKQFRYKLFRSNFRIWFSLWFYSHKRKKKRHFHMCFVLIFIPMQTFWHKMPMPMTYFIYIYVCVLEIMMRHT